MEEIFSAMHIMDASLGAWKILVRLLIAVVLGFTIGLQNRSRQKDAGLKTHTMLCLTACVLMIISKYGFYELAKFEGIQYDASRVASTIISGLCFLGAGMVFYKQETIKGLTTAVGMCLTIAIGMCIGSGLIITAVVVTLLEIILQFLLYSKFSLFKTQKYINVNAKFYYEENYVEHFKEIFEVKHFNKFKIVREGDKQVVEVEFNYRVKITSEELLQKIENEPQIIMLEKIEER